MSQKIKIKRSTGNSAPSSLENGELAYLHNNTTSALYIGRPGGGTGDIEIIGGKDFVTKLNGIETGATGDQTNLEIETAYNARVSKVSAGEITAGTETAVRRFSPKDIHDLIDTHQFATYVLPKATTTVRGGVKLTTNSTQGTAPQGVSSTANRSYAIQMNGSEQLVVNVPWQNTEYSVQDGELSQNNFTDTLKTKLDGIATSANNYTLPVATNAVTGGVRLGSNATSSVTPNSVTTTTGRTYRVQKNASHQLMVNVPWQNTTYSEGDGGLTTNNFTDALKSKLDGIAAGAQQCSQANVTLAGALMDSELANITAVKQLNQNLNTSNSPTFGGLNINNGTPVITMKTNSATVDDFRISVDSSSGDITFENHTNAGDQSGTITNFMNYNQYGLALGNGGANTSSQNGGVSVSGVLYANNSFQSTGTITGNSTMTVSGNVSLATGVGSTCQIATQGGGVTMGYITQNNTINGNTTCNHNFTALGDVQLGSDNNDTVTIKGNLTVEGSTTTIESTTLSVEDNEIILNSDYTSGTAPVSAGITVQRGDYTDAALNWNESTNVWQINKPSDDATAATGETIMTVQSFETDVPTIDGGTF